MTDIQFINYIDDESIAVMDATIEYANPDLIVVTGDQISPEYLGGQSGKARKICKQITGYFDSKEIPWTFMFPAITTEQWECCLKRNGGRIPKVGLLCRRT